MSSFWLCLLLIGMPTCLPAATVSNLYQAIVPVNSQTDKVRQKALPEAMEQILIKLTANPHIADDPKLMSYIKQAPKYVQQYYYKSVNDSAMLFVNFNSAAIDNLLQATGQTFWSVNRPLMLIWLVSELDEKQAAVEEDSRIGQQIKLTAEQMGIPAIFPTYDLEDMQQVTLDDIWAPNLATVVQGAQRYQADKLLVGKIVRKNSKNWVLNAYFGSYSGWQTISAAGEKPEELVQQTLAQILVQLAEANSTAATVNPLATTVKVEIVVNGITGLANYQQVLDYLQSLAIVRAVQVLNVGADQVSFNIATQSSQDELVQTLAQSDLLIPLPNTDPHLLEFELKSLVK